MRSLVIAVCILVQTGVLAWMVYGRETIISNGTVIRLATAPIDPRDPFRGDFVRLRYGLNSLLHAPMHWSPEEAQPVKGDKVYAVLQERPGGLHDVAWFTLEEPASEVLFLRGRLRRNLPVNGLPPGRNGVDVGYGIEQLFLEQGRGIHIEKRQGVRGGMQTAMHVRISLGKEGTAVLTGYDWNELAIGIELADDFALLRGTQGTQGTQGTRGTRGTESGRESSTAVSPAPAPAPAPAPNNPSAEATTAPDTSTSAPLTVTITNVSNEIVILNNPGDNCGFRLQPVARVTSAYVEPEGICTGLQDRAQTLMPEDSFSIAIDLADPRWHMSLVSEDETSTADIRSFTDAGEWFRVVYRPNTVDLPDPVESKRSATFWQGELISQAFNALGRID